MAKSDGDRRRSLRRMTSYSMVKLLEYCDMTSFNFYSDPEHVVRFVNNCFFQFHEITHYTAWTVKWASSSGASSGHWQLYYYFGNRGENRRKRNDLKRGETCQALRANNDYRRSQIMTSWNDPNTNSYQGTRLSEPDNFDHLMRRCSGMCLRYWIIYFYC